MLIRFPAPTCPVAPDLDGSGELTETQFYPPRTPDIKSQDGDNV